MAILSELQEQETSSYDVFLSFRGEDTRLTFIDHLYQALINGNIRTYLDDHEVETGKELKPELVRAIKSSHASIIVLSENYASSTWCLDELVMILEQHKTSNHFVLPIFYHVEPTHVRKINNSFGEAMAAHKEMFYAEKNKEKKSQNACKLKLWTEALTEVANLKGKEAIGRETVFIEEIVEEINSRLGIHLRSKLPHLIGRESSIYTISSWLKDNSSKTTVDILTIWGMAGIGKTTLAEYIYKLNYRDFERSSFVEGIERKCEEKSSALHDLQKQLLGDILRRKMTEVRDVNLCTTKIEKALLDKQTLLVLDGIDNFEQLNVLIGTKGFHHGSKIIITTKDGSLTEKCALFRTTFPPKHMVCRLFGLKDNDSLSLLCWHAFGADGPKEGYEQEAMRLATYCGGHPLALKVLGGTLINEDVATWSDIFEMLETKELHTEVQKVLQISFDSLPHNCQELFKHIACFFVGEDKTVAETILKECGIHTSYGMTKLIDRCLLTIGLKYELKMHHLVQEMGRDLVRQESRKKAWKLSRLWNHEESFNVLKQDRGTSKIQGLALDMNMLENGPIRGSSNVTEHQFQNILNKMFGAVPIIQWFYQLFSLIVGFFASFFLMFSSSTKTELRTNALGKMDNLKLLQLNHAKLKGSYANFPKGLRWLCMRGFLLKYIPSELPMQNLVSLDMSYSDLKQLWEKPTLLGSLKYLNLSYSKLVKVGGFSKLPSLERLQLVGCASLIEVCESIGGCDRLVLLDMNYCYKLKMLPSTIGRLKIRLLYLNGYTGAKEFLWEAKEMELLKVQEADCISSKVHASLSLLTKSVPRSPTSFFLSFSPKLGLLSLVDNNLCNESFPKDLSFMTSLKTLYLDGNPIVSIPDCVRSLSSLEFLSLDRCFMLKSILCPPSTVNGLSARKCEALVKIVFHPEMSRPAFLSYQLSESIKEIEGIIKFQVLAQINEDILCRLGWKNLQDVKGQEVKMISLLRWFGAKKVPVQMFYEFGIFSTCYIGKEVPDWLTHKSKGPSISFIMPLSPLNKSIRGFNICYVRTFLGRIDASRILIKIRNMTKNCSWIYMSLEGGVPEADEDIVWLIHWMFRNNEFEDGDEVCLTVFQHEESGMMVKECAISPLYDDDDDGYDENDPLCYYKSCKLPTIGRDLSYYQLTSGDYFMLHLRSTMGVVAKLFHNTLANMFREGTPLWEFIGYVPRYKDVEEFGVFKTISIDADSLSFRS